MGALALWAAAWQDTLDVPFLSTGSVTITILMDELATRHYFSSSTMAAF